MTKRRKGIGGHQSANSRTDVWLTPPEIIAALGPFDMDPCAAIDQPWRTAHEMLTIDDDGLSKPWRGTVWLNPPYGRETGIWLQRLAEHGDGVALVFARTETRMFFDSVWGAADAALFLRGRLHFHRPDGERSKINAGGPSVLLAYGKCGVKKIEKSGISGAFMRLVNPIVGSGR